MTLKNTGYVYTYIYIYTYFHHLALKYSHRCPKTGIYSECIKVYQETPNVTTTAINTTFVSYSKCQSRVSDNREKDGEKIYGILSQKGITNYFPLKIENNINTQA